MLQIYYKEAINKLRLALTWTISPTILFRQPINDFGQKRVFLYHFNQKTKNERIYKKNKRNTRSARTQG